ncbi:MAG: type II secretion system protein, partial [Arenimonas sp.]
MSVATVRPGVSRCSRPKPAAARVRAPGPRLARGFSLIEIVVVVMLIAMATALVAGLVNS